MRGGNWYHNDYRQKGIVLFLREENQSDRGKWYFYTINLDSYT